MTPMKLERNKAGDNSEGPQECLWLLWQVLSPGGEWDDKQSQNIKCRQNIRKYNITSYFHTSRQAQVRTRPKESIYLDLPNQFVTTSVICSVFHPSHNRSFSISFLFRKRHKTQMSKVRGQQCGFAEETKLTSFPALPLPIFGELCYCSCFVTGG